MIIIVDCVEDKRFWFDGTKNWRNILIPFFFLVKCEDYFSTSYFVVGGSKQNQQMDERRTCE